MVRTKFLFSIAASGFFGTIQRGVAEKASETRPTDFPGWVMVNKTLVVLIELELLFRKVVWFQADLELVYWLRREGQLVIFGFVNGSLQVELTMLLLFPTAQQL